PRCQRGIVVPGGGASETPTGAEQDELRLIDPLSAGTPTKMAASEQEGLEAEYDSATQRRAEALLSSLGIRPLPQHTGERRHAWPIDILLYPTSPSGLCILGVLVGIPLALTLFRRLLGNAGRVIGYALAFAGLLIGLYAMWYLAECIYDSARGGTRAPEMPVEKTDWRQMFSRVVYLAAVGVVFILPARLYVMFTNRSDGIYWALVVWGVVFFPMGLLAMVAHDSESALNPFFLLGAIFRTLGEYVCLMILFAIVTAPLWLSSRDSQDSPPAIWREMLGNAIAAYGAFLLAHVLGRFYWRNRERLDWGI
ncbi:MAG: hypothetical protein ACYTAS_00230, partial [Planctomycetota bacterium]